MPWVSAECTSSLSGVRHPLATKSGDDKTPDFERREVRSAWKDCTELEKLGAMSLAINENSTTIKSGSAKDDDRHIAWSTWQTGNDEVTPHRQASDGSKAL